MPMRRVASGVPVIPGPNRQDPGGESARGVAVAGLSGQRAGELKPTDRGCQGIGRSVRLMTNTDFACRAGAPGKLRAKL
jgi:hypothetical protein